MEKQRKTKIHYGWVIVAAGLMMTCAQGIYGSCASVFIKPVCAQLGFLRSEFTLYITINSIISAVMLPVYGSVINRWGVKRVCLTSAVVCGSVLMLYSFAESLWHFYALAVVGGLFVNGFSVMAVSILVNNWFESRKGLATGIALCGSALMAALIVPLSNKVIEAMDWRAAYRFQSLCFLGILLPTVLFLVKDKPRQKGLAPYGAGEIAVVLSSDAPAGVLFGDAVKCSSFYLLAFAAFGMTFCQSGHYSAVIPFLTDEGFSSGFASLVSSLMMVLLTAWKVGLGFVLDKTGPVKGSIFIGITSVLCPLTALLIHIPAMPYVYAVILAVSTTGPTILLTFLVSSYFGRRDYSRIYSVVSMFSYAGSAASAPLLNLTYDKTGTYMTAWPFISGFAVLVTLMLVLAYRFRPKIEQV